MVYKRFLCYIPSILDGNGFYILDPRFFEGTSEKLLPGCQVISIAFHTPSFWVFAQIPNRKTMALSQNFELEYRDIQLEEARQAEYERQMERYFDQLADTDGEG